MGMMMMMGLPGRVPPLAPAPAGRRFAHFDPCRRIERSGRSESRASVGRAMVMAPALALPRELVLARVLALPALALVLAALAPAALPVSLALAALALALLLAP